MYLQSSSFSFAFTLGFQFPLPIWWSSVGYPRLLKASPGVLLVMAIFLLSIPDGSCMSVKCGRCLALPLHRSTSEMTLSVILIIIYTILIVFMYLFLQHNIRSTFRPTVTQNRVLRVTKRIYIHRSKVCPQ